MGEAVVISESRGHAHRTSAEALHAELAQPTDALDILIEVLLLALLVAAPIVMGAVAPWARSVVFCAALMLLTLWLLQAARRGRLRIVKSWVWLFVLLFFGVAVVQLVPLSPRLLASVSPGTASTYDELGPFTSVEARTLSLFPYGARTELLRLAALAMICFVVMHAVRTRWQAIGIIVALAAIGVFEALYGMGEHFSGSHRIFWHQRSAHLAAVTGTFWNKNHFAGLLAMILPATLGLLLAILPQRRKVGTARARILEALSSPRVQAPLFLGAASVLMAVAICFSLSRAGILAMLASLVALAVYLGLSAGLRKYTVLLLLLVTAILLMAVVIGAEMVVDHLEVAVSGRSASWADRVDLARSAVHLVKTFPLLGTGLGSFRYVFERFQSPRFGDRIADFLHNDWLQIFCETGILGGAIVIGGFVFFILSTARAAFSRKDVFCRSVSLGALVGVGAMLLHSFFDYNLLKITSNGIVFATLLGLAYAAARLPARGRRSPDRGQYVTLPLGPAPARVALAVCLVAGAAYLSLGPIRIARADFAFNRFLAGSGLRPPDSHFFMPIHRSSSAVAPEADLARAQGMAPEDPRYDYYAALFLAVEADTLVRERARETVRQVMGPAGIERSDPEVIERIAQAVAADLGQHGCPERVELLTRAEQQLRRALGRLPVSARYHLLMARILAARAEIEASLDRTHPDLEAASLYAGRALQLAPNKPYALFHGGKILLQQALGTREEQACARRVSGGCQHLRHAIFADPAYADRIYPIVRAALGGTKAMLAVTPRNLRAYERLARALWDAGEWEELLICLDTISDLANDRLARDGEMSAGSLLAQSSRVVDEDPSEKHYAGAVGYDFRDPMSVRLSVAERRYKVLSILGRWEERAELVTQSRDLLREWAESRMAEARRLRSKGRLREALAVLLGVLQRNWSHPETLLSAAEIASHPDVAQHSPPWQDPLDHLFRLVINNAELSPGDYERAVAIVKSQNLSRPADRLAADFICGAGAIVAGRAEQGVEILRRAISTSGDMDATWQQAHLFHYYLGVGCEKLGRRDEAIAAYRRVIAAVPSHRPALLRLRELDGEDPSVRERLAALQPKVPLSVNFGGKLVLLGYSLEREAVPVDIYGVKLAQERWVITYYWEAHDRLHPQYFPTILFRDDSWETLFRNDHRLRNVGEQYSADFPRCGEVVVDRWGLDHDLDSVQYLEVGIWAPETPKLLPSFLFPDGFHNSVPVRLQIPAPSRERLALRTNHASAP